jgi:hypothetical protein
MEMYRRERKRIERLRQKAALQIQTFYRCRKQKHWFKVNYRSLVRMRALRIRKKREAAATIIQRYFRGYFTRKKVAELLVQFRERQRLERELRDLERALEGLHGNWMKELLVIRAQTGIRGHLARE